MDSYENFRRFYHVFRDIIRVVHSSTRVDELLELVAWKSAGILKAKGSAIRILNLKTEELEPFACHGMGEKYISKEPLSGKDIIQNLCKQKKAVIIKDMASDPRVEHPRELMEEGIQMILDIPLILRNDVIGMIRLFFTEEQEFSQDELDFAVAIAEQCACAIDKARLVEEKQSQYDQLAMQTEKLSALGRMAAGIAHEINNPLAGILLFSSNMVKKVPPEGPIKQGLDVIIRESQRCKGIIQDLLEFSRDREPERLLANLNEVVEKSLSIVDNEFHLRHIFVEKNLSSNLQDIPLDVNLMQQVFVNLLMNAGEAIGSDGKIVIRTEARPERKKQVVEIADTGPGISEENLDNIFDPFFSTKANGTGLGLAVSYGIVQKHRGNIFVSSRPGEGARFTVEIPLGR